MTDNRHLEDDGENDKMMDPSSPSYDGNLAHVKEEEPETGRTKTVIDKVPITRTQASALRNLSHSTPNTIIASSTTPDSDDPMTCGQLALEWAIHHTLKSISRQVRIK